MYLPHNYVCKVFLSLLASQPHWDPGEWTSREARKALAEEESRTGIPHEDAIPPFERVVRRHWQQEWDMEQDSKLHITQPHTYPLHGGKHTPRSLKILYRCLWIGHTCLTHHHLLRGQDFPVCVQCGDSLTLLQMLASCLYFDPAASSVLMPCTDTMSLSTQHFCWAMALLCILRIPSVSSSDIFKVCHKFYWCSPTVIISTSVL